ncbi:ABC-2 type transport system permease protein [Actinacidiphila paucisporea]|uniref:ABC-2 type transport system permease protein n=2 Tax=Actinacidiphila paucisporea TaxID=310782 RepID=A0A1M6WGX4_9ACTN|nr:ABC-2 type transport system permease protein [Actinacidiphila paucisporea]
MAESAARTRATPAAERTPGAVAESVRAYRLVVGMWMRSTMAYRASFVMTALGNLAATALDFVTIVLMFSHIHALGGFTLPEIALLYGTASTSFGLADLLAGSLDRLGERVRDGTFDTLLLRPAPVLAQVAADRFALRRLGRVTQGVLVLGWSLPRVDVHWTVVNVALLPVTLLAGAAIFCAVFVAGGAFQFWAGDAAQVQNSVTYGGATLLQYPPGIFSRELLRGVTFVVPLAFVNWLPCLRMLGRPDPLGLPGWVDFAGVPVALLCCALAGVVWRAGVRSYRSTGS